MGGQQSKDNSTLDQLQDSRDAMKKRDEHHLEKNGKQGNVCYVPRHSAAPPEPMSSRTVNSANSTSSTVSSSSMPKQRSPIQCIET